MWSILCHLQELLLLFQSLPYTCTLYPSLREARSFAGLSQRMGQVSTNDQCASCMDLGWPVVTHGALLHFETGLWDHHDRLIEWLGPILHESTLLGFSTSMLRCQWSSELIGDCSIPSGNEPIMKRATEFLEVGRVSGVNPNRYCAMYYPVLRSIHTHHEDAKRSIRFYLYVLYCVGLLQRSLVQPWGTFRAVLLTDVRNVLEGLEGFWDAWQHLIISPIEAGFVEENASRYSEAVQTKTYYL